ncbi:MAG: glycoside hydrolase family 2 protein [Polaribacter sp.]|nr:glycoside hydrolase family 2 protein [Polaribacter sp.]
MKRNLLILLFVLLNFLACQKNKKHIPTSFEINKNWTFKAADSNTWKTATVPGNVFTDLLDHRLIPDPFQKNNEEKVQWVSNKNWEYKTSFTLSKETLQKQHVYLNFEGLDTYASIYLNDTLIEQTTNAFRTYLLPIKQVAKTTNELRILFEKTDVKETIEQEKLGYQLPEGKRIFTRKAQFQYGWDWGPKLATSGIWKPISVKAWDGLRFEDIFIKQQTLTKEKASLLIELSIESDADQETTIITSVNKKSSTVNIPVKKGVHHYTIPFEIENPKLWWTHNLGTPYLYHFDFKLTLNGVVKDEKSIKKGIRTIELITEKEATGAHFYFKLNGIPVYMKGANYIPQNSFQNNVTSKHYEKLLSDVVNSNMNMLRVWGGGIYEDDIFYDLCDQKGILVWQDFMFACAMYPGDTAYLKNVQQEAIDQVKRLRNHSSIALWCGNNENSEGWNRWDWQADRSEKEKQEIWKNYLKVFDSILPKTVAALSDGNSYWESSPKYGRGNPKYEFEGDAHDWWVWHDAAPFEHFEEKIPRFMSEFGFQSFPSYQSIRYINQNEHIDIQTPAIKSHQKHSKGFQLIAAYMERDYRIPSKDEDYVYLSQLLQAKGITMGIEAHRRAKPYNMGTLFWQLNDCWPAISWSSIDFFGNWKALQYKAKKSFKNILISSTLKNNVLDTYIVNDYIESKSGNLHLKIIDFSGQEIWARNNTITVAKNTSSKVFQVSLDSLKINPKNTVLIASFLNNSSYYYFDKPKNLELHNASIKQEITKIATGFSIALKSTTLQKDVFLHSSAKGHFDDNFFDLLPNQEKVIYFKTTATSLDDLQIKSLNLIYN